jgi:hypothetical protein
MFCSPTHNAALSHLKELENTSMAFLEPNASLEEKITRMAEFISIASLILVGREGSETLELSMSKVTTPMLVLLKAHQKRVGTMRQRMVTQFGPHWIDLARAEVAVYQMWKNGLSSRVQLIVSRFGDWYTNWIPKVRLVIFANSKHIVTGSMLLLSESTKHLSGLSSMEETLMEEMSGYDKLVLDWETHQ